ncbi:MAG: ATP-binding cassette domain-containing protein [Pirellulales bacterium]
MQVGPHDALSSAAKRLLGYCPGSELFYEEMTGREFVLTLTQLSAIGSETKSARTETALELVGMVDRAERRMRGYSHGMRQRIKLAQAVAHEPQVLCSTNRSRASIRAGGARSTI